MTRALEDRHALVTGTSSGIGRAIAERLLAQGWNVTGLDVAPPALAAERFTPVWTDLTDAEAIRAACRGPRPLQALVHAAGVLRVGRIGALDAADGELMWRIHVQAAALLADALVPTIPAGGRIVLIGSRAAGGMPERSQYAATKAALVGMARSWAAELVARGITVNVVSPGATDTAMLRDPARAGVPPRLPPIGRLIRAEEVAAVVAFLLSDEAGAITGQEIRVDGGGSLRR